jgi:hypothetical protein
MIHNDGTHVQNTPAQASCAGNGEAPQEAVICHTSSSSRVTDSCAACGKTAAEVGIKKLLKCSACMIEPLYCSGECQRVC